MPNPQPIETRTVEWTVLTPETIPDSDDWSYFGLTADEYEDLALNQADILRWVREAAWRLRYYRGEIEIAEPE